MLQNKFSMTEKEFHNNLNVKAVTYNILFWKTVKATFADKTLENERITLIGK